MLGGRPVQDLLRGASYDYYQQERPAKLKHVMEYNSKRMGCQD